MSFLKSFLTGEKSLEEQVLLAKQKQHDVMVVDASDDEPEEESCAAPKQGCGGCGCRS